MSRPSQAVVLLLLLGSALAFRISQHHVHKKDGHDHDLQPAHRQLREMQDNKQLEDTENSILEDDEMVTNQNTATSEVSNVKSSDEDTEDNNQENNEDNTQEDTKEKTQKVVKDTSPEDTDALRKTLILSTSGKTVNECLSNASVAFSAELSSDVEISSGSTIVFDNVLVNEGGLYFGTSGQFSCTDEGVYVFMWSLRHTGSYRGLGALAFGGENIKSGPQTSYYSSSTYNGNSQMVSAVQCRLSPVTSVTVRSMYSSAPTYMAGFSSFAGFRLSTDAASAVAFTAELSKNVFMSPGVRIMFDHIVSNVGGHYDSQHNFFRCPDNGVYSFSVSTYYPEASNQWSVSRLVFDGAPVLQGPMTYRATTSYDSGSSSVTVLMQCQQGKDFYVESDKSYEFDYTEYGANLTSFSGFRLCSQCDDLVAFSAVLTDNVTTDDVDIPFKSLLLIRGGAYNRMTGVFTCPDDALYMFHWSATSISGYCYLDLYVDDSLTKRSFTTNQDSTDSYGTSGTSSQSVVIRCSAGDAVSLRGDSLSSSKILLADYSTFSGYRLPGQ